MQEKVPETFPKRMKKELHTTLFVSIFAPWETYCSKSPWRGPLAWVSSGGSQVTRAAVELTSLSSSLRGAASITKQTGETELKNGGRNRRQKIRQPSWKTSLNIAIVRAVYQVHQVSF